jgi:site-specific DNA-methyltransferase (adenine-specific)
MRLVALSVRGIQVPALSQLASTHAHETLLWASKSKCGARHTFNYDLINSGDPTSQLSSLWHIPAVPMREKSLVRHPTQKPLRILRHAVLTSTRAGELIFDLFSGSGTTGAAAKELDRFFVGAETKREYAEMAGRRIGAAERGSRRGRSGPSATGTRKVVGGSSAWSNTRLG